MNEYLFNFTIPCSTFGFFLNFGRKFKFHLQASAVRSRYDGVSGFKWLVRGWPSYWLFIDIKPGVSLGILHSEIGWQRMHNLEKMNKTIGHGC